MEITSGSKRPWSDEEDDLIIKWWTEGASARAIGQRLNRNRNSIAGRMHRLKQRGKLQTRTALLSGACAPEWTKPVIRTPKPRPKPRSVSQIKTPEQGTLFLQLEEPITGVSLLDLRDWHCRSVTSMDGGPYQTALYCGKLITQGKSYCSDHHKLYYVKPKPRERGKSNGH